MKLFLSASALAIAAVAGTAAWSQSQPASQAAAPRAADKPTYGSFGFDAAGMDRQVQPGDDFYGFANGGWAKATAIPADKSSYGSFNILSDLSEARTRGILDEAAKDGGSKIGRAYATYSDTAAIEAKGLAPMQPWIAKVKGLKDRAAYPALLAEATRAGIRGPFAGYVGQDDKQPEVYALTLSQAGLGMPDRDYYLKPDAKLAETKAAYQAHIARQLTNAGEADAAARAAALVAFETQIAEVSWTRVDSRDATKTYNKMSVADL